MSVIFAEIDFDKWIENDSFNFNIENNEIKFSNSFLKLSLKGLNNEIISDNFYYDKNEQILLIVRGKILIEKIQQSASAHQLSILIKNYKEKNLEFLEQAHGSFNLVLIDLRNKKVLLCNDKVGVLRIYYKYKDNQLLISSNIALLTENSTIDANGLIQYGLLNYFYDENTIFSNVKWILPGFILEFNKEKIKQFHYFNLLQFIIDNKSKSKINLESTVQTLKDIISQYSNGNEVLLTLTSGFDSRLLLSGINKNEIGFSAFTFGRENNMEFSVAEIILNQSKKVDYYKILLDNKFEEFSKSYLDYIIRTKNIELNFNRYHYVFIWEKLLELKINSNVFTGLCGDSFLRDGLKVNNQTNELLYNLIYTDNKEQILKNYLNNKKDFISALGLNQNFVFDYLTNLISPIINNDKYFNHFFIKVNFGIQKYFATELNTENLFLNTFSPFLDINYITSLISSGYSIVTHNFLDNKFSYQHLSHKYYASLVKNYDEKLLYINTNRGYPLNYELSNMLVPLKLIRYYLNKKKKHIVDLNYSKWRAEYKLNVSTKFNFDENIKLEVLKNVI